LIVEAIRWNLIGLGIRSEEHAQRSLP
jgi:hypothetical protein